ncbi:MAG: tRNA dihydrouridine(20/20a) synthase DusA, partial [Kocuria rhizophila]
EPWAILGAADRLWGETPPLASPVAAAEAIRQVLARPLAAGGRMHQITRHMLGLFHGRPGARQWKRILSERASQGTLADYDAALAAVSVDAA